MSPWEFPGFVSGLVAVWMFLVAALVAAAASVRVLTTLRRPGKGGGARGLLVWAGLVGIAAIALFAAGQTRTVPTGVKVAADRAAPWIGAAALLAAPLLAWSVARRLRRRAPSAPPAQTPGVTPVDGERVDEAKL